MAQYDVFRAPRKNKILIVDVQSHLLRDLSTRVVLPLVPTPDAPRRPYDRLNPELLILKQPYILMTQDATSLHISQMGRSIANIAAQDREITDAIDFLFHGF